MTVPFGRDRAADLSKPVRNECILGFPAASERTLREGIRRIASSAGERLYFPNADQELLEAGVEVGSFFVTELGVRRIRQRPEDLVLLIQQPKRFRLGACRAWHVDLSISGCNLRTAHARAVTACSAMP
jgi:hypothetical protein